MKPSIEFPYFKIGYTIATQIILNFCYDRLPPYICNKPNTYIIITEVKLSNSCLVQWLELLRMIIKNGAERTSE